MKMSVIIALIAFLSFSCLSEDKFPKTLKLHARSEIGGATLWVVPANDNKNFDSLAIDLPKDGSKIDHNWKPNMGEGSFAFGIVGKDHLRDTVGYFTNGVIVHGKEYWITVYPDSLYFGTNGFE